MLQIICYKLGDIMFARLKNQGFTSFKSFLTSGPLHVLLLSLPGIPASDFFSYCYGKP